MNLTQMLALGSLTPILIRNPDPDPDPIPIHRQRTPAPVAVPV